jgi:DNA uptake protein ComE-like DNA-binding protein
MAHVKKKQLNFQNSLKDYFSLSYKVKRGLMVLFVLIAAEIITLVWLHYLPDAAEPVDYTAFKKEIDAFYAASENNQKNAVAEKRFKSADEKNISAAGHDISKAELFFFNPNQLPDKDWERLGFSEKQVHSIKNYESKGGVFKTKSDVKKMYAISEPEFNRIAPFIDLPEEKKDEPKTFKKINKPFLIVDIGKADSTELSTLPMVGEYLAYKIHNYREKLGGFYSISQLKEVRGLRDSTYLVILPHVILEDSTNLRKINLNTAGYEELNMHPYINSKIANVVLAYRKQHGLFQNVSDLQKVALVDAELYRKIAPYLKVE